MFPVKGWSGIGRAALAAALGIGLAAQAAASAPDRDQEDPIIVTGSIPSPEETRRRAVEFVRLTGVASGRVQAARWADPVCPQALGLDDAYARMVETRVRDVAQAARVPVAREPCRANIVVSFAPDAGAIVRRVAARASRRLNEVRQDARAELLEGGAPIRWWYSTDMRSRHGMRAGATPPPFTGGDGAEGGGSMLPGGIPSMTHYDSSMISTQAVRVLTSATIVVDMTKADGMTLDSVASYAALVALAEIRRAAPPPPGSILGLFEGESSARALTDSDMAFLRALYRLPLDRGARLHRGFLVRELVADQMGERQP